MNDIVTRKDGVKIDLAAIDAKETLRLALDLAETGDLKSIIAYLGHHIDMRDAVIAQQMEHARRGLKHSTASEYLLTLHNSGGDDKQKRVEAREAIERAMAEFDPATARAALGTILLLAVLEGR